MFELLLLIYLLPLIAIVALLLKLAIGAGQGGVSTGSMAGQEVICSFRKGAAAGFRFHCGK